MGGKMLGGVSKSWEEAMVIADSFGKVLEASGLVSEYEIAGSLRRLVRNKPINDIDVVVTPKDVNEFSGWIKQHYPECVGGSAKASILYKEMQVDILFATKDNFGSMLLYFTGSKNYNIAMRTKAKKLGYKLSEKGLWDSNNNILAYSEEGIFHALGMEYRTPEKR